MNDNRNDEGGDKPEGNSGGVNDSGAFTQRFQHQPVAARVPEKVGRGVISTGVLVLDGPHEFILDFLQGLTRPHQVAARVVIPAPVMEHLIAAVQDNLGKYTQSFGAPPALPKPPSQRPTIAEIYENFKLPDELLSGTYANSIMIGHSPSEFFFDFITGFYPTAAVSARVYLSAPQIPRMLDTLTMALAQYRKRRQQEPGNSSDSSAGS